LDKKRGNFDLELILLNLVFPNFTILIDPHIAPVKKTNFLVEILGATTSHFQFDLKGVYFVHCSNLVETGGLSLLGYTSAYDLATWIALISATLLTSLFLYFYLNSKIGAESSISHIILAEFAYQVLLEQGINVVHKCRLVSGGWLLAGIVLSTLYRGGNINQLIAPFPIKRLNTFEKILEKNFTVYTKDFNAFLSGIVENSFANALSGWSNLLIQFIPPIPFSPWLKFVWTNGNKTNLTRIEQRFLNLTYFPNSTQEVKDMKNLRYFKQKFLNVKGKLLSILMRRFTKFMVSWLTNFLNEKWLGKDPNQVTMSVDSFGKLTRRWQFRWVP